MSKISLLPLSFDDQHTHGIGGDGMGGEDWLPMLETLSDRELEILDHLAGGLSNREIAERLFLSLNTIKWHNRQIYSKLGVADRKQAVSRARQAGLLGALQPTQVDSTTKPRHNLPVMATSFVGREDEFADVCRLLESSRLLTLIGWGGAGKTRLTLQVAWKMVDVFTDGVFLVELAAIRDPALVEHAIARALDVKEISGAPLITTLKHYLRNKNLLLVMDNFEHLLVAASVLSSLLEVSPELKVLATSREILQLYGEQVYPLGPLESAHAVELFSQRARAVLPDFALTDENLSAVEGICRRFEGLPLAIELAAARVRLLPPHVLLSRLDSRLDALKVSTRDLPPRHQTLRATLDWSYNLLEPSEQLLFKRLGVFAGGCTLDAAEAVCREGLPLDLFTGLESLLNKSLLSQAVDKSGEPRFLMLETVREYALERLAESEESGVLHQRYAAYFLALAERVEAKLRGPDQGQWAEQLENDFDNLRASLAWSLSGADIDLGLRLVGALGWFWWLRGHYTEGQQWTSRALAEGAQAPQEVLATVLNGAGYIAFALGDYAQAKTYHQAALDHYLQQGDEWHRSWSMFCLSVQLIMLGELNQALAFLEEALEIARQLDNNYLIAHILNSQGFAWDALGDRDRAVVHYEEGLSLAQSTRQENLISYFTSNLGEQALMQRNLVRAHSLFQEGLATAQAIGDRRMVSTMLGYLGEVARHEGNYTRARELCDEALAISREMDDQPKIAEALIRLGSIARAQGDSRRAAAYFCECLVLNQELDSQEDIAYCLAGMAALAEDEQHFELAARLYGAAELLLESIKTPGRFADFADYKAIVRAARAHLPTAMWAVGRTMSLEGVVTLALDYGKQI